MNGKGKSWEALALVVLFLGITVLTVFGFVARDWMPAAASEHGAGVDGMIRYLLLTTGAVFIAGHLVLASFVWRYARGGPTGSPWADPRVERWWSLLPVVAMALIAEVGVLVIGLPVWAKVYGPVPEDAVVIEVTARQFEWIVRYSGKDGRFGRTDPALIRGAANPAGLDPRDPAGADDLVFRNRLHVPVGGTVYLRLRSRDVLHSFSVPAFRVKQDVVPGIVGSTMFVPTAAGEYEIACMELCGMAHYRMRGRVLVQSPEEFDAWLSQQAGWLQ